MSILGIDIGTQSLKAVVCDQELRVIGRASRAYGYRVPQPGWAEQDPQLWLDAARPVIAAALAAAQRSPEDIQAVGLAGQLDGCVPVADDGGALSPALIWMDRRATDQLPALDPEQLLVITGQVADPSHMAAKIAWLKSTGLKARFHQPVSFLLEQMCGARFIDPGHASTTMLFDQVSGDYSERLLAAFGIEREELPEVRPAHLLAGRVDRRGAEHTGLQVGTAVCVGTGDDFATPLGGGIAGPGTLACVLGTAEVVGAVTNERVLDHGALVETHNYVGGRYFVENPGWLAGGTARWASEMFGLASDDELDALAASSEPGAGGVCFIPALTGAMAPKWLPDARACFYGMSAATGRAELARAVLEGCAFAMNDVVTRLAELGIECHDIGLLGGGARSDVWAQIRADVSGLPVRAAAEIETCALGAAALAAVAIGVIPSIDEAATRLACLGEPRLPRADMSTAYERYQALFRELERML